jgi:hypothetical protein
MTRLSRAHLLNRAPALAAALVLGTAVLSLMPSQTAHAAWGVEIESVSPAPGSGSTTSARDNRDINDWQKCSIKTSDGTIHWYLPGDVVIVETRYGKKRLVCGGPDWIVYRTEEDPVRSTGTGIRTLAP